MFWTYKNGDFNSKQDYIDLLNEIEAYRALDGLDFDFGTGLIVNEMSYGSEDAYYEMDIQSLEEIIEFWDEEHIPVIRKRKERTHKRYLKQKHKAKLNHLSDKSWSTVRERDGWKQRCYRGGRSAFLKKRSNKKVRRYIGGLPPKGNTHNRIFDFWWSLN
ncbi:hypothetical protein MZM54_04185 [[Brevibacterium] frigoritolerans]|nr:hypothetical protein [Peribacillus frigoritolerans]